MQPWHTLNYQDDEQLCMHDLPVVPKEPLIPNSTFNGTVEREVLLEMFWKTNGLNWYNNSGWRTPTRTPHCQWYGVKCSNSTDGHVTVLSLRSNNLNGRLPATLWMLRDLQGLCLKANPKLHGRLTVRMENTGGGSLKTLRMW